jgi:hypothetical protein
MPTSPNYSGLRDNHTRGSVADFLRAKIQDQSKLSVVSAYFTIYAYGALKDALERVDHLDFLFGEPSFVNRLDPSKAVDSLAATFRKRSASGLQSGRSFVLPDAQEQVHDKTDLELVTWLVIKEDK